MPRPSQSLEIKFAQALLEACAESERIGYAPTEFKAMIITGDAVKVAKALVTSGEIHSGLVKLKDLGRLDLSLEEIMLKPEFASLFSRPELDAAKWRLDLLSN